MKNHQINTIIEQNILKDADKALLEKMKYMMEFGDISIQYDFCLN